MKFKKGEIIEKINAKQERKLYIVTSVKEENQVYITAKIETSKPEKNKKWHYILENNGDTLYIKYSNFSPLLEEEIIESDYRIYTNTYDLINKLYELNEDTKDERKEERKQKYKDRIKRKREINKLANKCKKEDSRKSLPSFKGMKDSAYRGKVSIVSGGGCSGK